MSKECINFFGPLCIRCLQTKFSQLGDLEPKIIADGMLDIRGNFFLKFVTKMRMHGLFEMPSVCK